MRYKGARLRQAGPLGVPQNVVSYASLTVLQKLLTMSRMQPTIMQTAQATVA